MTPDRLDELIDLHLDALADDAERTELASALRADGAARRRFVERSLMDVHLYRLCGAEEAADGEAQAAAAQPRHARLFGWRRWAAAGAAVAACAVLGTAAWVAWHGARPPAQPARAARVLSGTVEVGGAVKTDIAAGATAAVVGAEPAVMALADGSRAELRAAEAVFHVAAAGERRVVELNSGGGRFDVARGRGEFRVQTPVGAVTALGTAFDVQVVEGRRRQKGKPNGDVRREGEGDRRERTKESERREEEGVQRERPRRGEPRPDGERRDAGSGVHGDKPGEGDLKREGEAPARRGEPEQARRMTVFVHSGRVRAEYAGRSYELAAGQSLEFVGKESTVREGPLIGGRLTGVDLAGRTVSLVRGGDRPAAGTYALAAETAVEIDGRAASLSDLREGMQASLRLAAAAEEVVRIRVAGPDVRGRIAASDAEAGLLTLRIGEGSRYANYAVAPNAVVTLDGAPSSLSELSEGMAAQVRLTVDGKRAMEVRATTGANRRDAEDAERRRDR
jgi:hypothetical protein